MTKVKGLLQLIRWPNLLIIIATQILVFQYATFETNSILNDLDYLFLIASTVFIAIGGYILNDVNDSKIDAINNKSLYELDWSNKTLKIVSYSSLMVGLVFGFIASISVHVKVFLLFLVPTLMVILYAKFLSRYKTMGNLLVSGLVALTVLVAYSYIRVSYGSYPGCTKEAEVIGFLALCAFIINWLREVVKDIEDIEGDAVGGRLTLPILVGPKSTTIGVFIVFTVFVCALSAFLISKEFYLAFSLIIALAVLILFKLSKAELKEHYHDISLLLKGFMLLGLVLFVSLIL